MIPVEQARQYLEQLGCSQAAAVLDSHLETAAHRQRTYAEFLADLLGVEVAARRERYRLFQPVTRRLHPAIAAFVSAIAYEGRLESLPACGRQRVAGPPPWGGAGLRWMPVVHAGRTTSAPEEADAVAWAVDQLLRCRWVGPDGVERPLRLDDIVVVAAFNAQVGRLEARLPAGARVGTVDRFQGQEATVAIYSLAASDAEQVPRGLEFLLNLNRLNVAISRARALAVLVCSPALLEAASDDPDRLRLVNALCEFAGRAERIRRH